MTVEIIQGDALEVLRTMDAESVHSIVTDPPYGLGFMGKDWDRGVPGAHFWQEMLRVAKPGAHLLAFGGTRTFHRMACAIEDAGWEIRDCIMWVYGSGFPKSLDVSKAIDKAAGAERKTIRVNERGSGAHKIKLNNHGPGDTGIGYMDGSGKVFNVTAPATEAAKQWSGWGTSLKPAWEPIIVARKPLVGSVADNVLAHGVGGINVDGCRVPTDDEALPRNGEPTTHSRYSERGSTDFAATPGARRGRPLRKARRNDESDENRNAYSRGLAGSVAAGETTLGRWPANVIHDGSDEVVELFPQDAGAFAPVRGTEPSKPAKNTYGEYSRGGGAFHGDAGSAARFFYCAKASGDDRESWNNHPTVKPLALMRYLVRLVTPEGATVLDPFLGSGTTAKAAMHEGCNCIGIELNPDYVTLAKRRTKQRSLLA